MITPQKEGFDMIKKIVRRINELMWEHGWKVDDLAEHAQIPHAIPFNI